MAGKKEFQRSLEQNRESHKSSSSFSLSKPEAEEMGESSKGGGEPALCWRAEVDQNLKRLHSLLFGVDHFLDKRDFESAQLLGLRLLGFIDSCSLSDADLQLARSIRREVASKVDAARRALVPDSDRYMHVASFWFCKLFSTTLSLGVWFIFEIY